MKPPHIEPTDYPREVIVKMAKEAIDQSHTEVELFFKATCPHCSERCMFQEPFKLYANMECSRCKKEFPVERAGYALVYKFN